MPVYDYRCDKCGDLFSLTRTIQEHEKTKTRCPKCKSTRVSRRFTSVSVKTSKKS
jgi:putative FmdB family regulatory protein